MNRRVSLRALLGSLLLAVSFAPAADANSFAFTTLPLTGNVVAAPGETVGWGYVLANDSADEWLITIGLATDPFLNGTPNLIFDFPFLAPSSSLNRPYDSSLPAGLFEFTWDLSAPSGFANLGVFRLNAEWWDGDPLNGGAFLRSAPDVFLNYSVAVGATDTTVPEPTTLVLMSVGIASLAAKRRKGQLPRRSSARKNA